MSEGNVGQRADTFMECTQVSGISSLGKQLKQTGEVGAMEIGWQLRALTALVEDPGLVPSTHMIAHTF